MGILFLLYAVKYLSPATKREDRQTGMAHTQGNRDNTRKNNSSAGAAAGAAENTAAALDISVARRTLEAASSARGWRAWAVFPSTALELRATTKRFGLGVRRVLSSSTIPHSNNNSNSSSCNISRYLARGGEVPQYLKASPGIFGEPILLATSPAAAAAAISPPASPASDERGDNKKIPGQDIWRHSALRYAGYANEVGESFRFIAPRFVVPSYAISIGYVCGDTIDKAYRAHSEGKGAKAAAKMGFDVLLWQSLASVAVPGLTINIVVKAMTAAMATDQSTRLLSKVARKLAPTAVGLGIIPVIIHPIDEAVTWAMDESVRKWSKVNAEAPDAGP